MSKIKHQFDSTFSACHITLPEAALQERRPGRIHERGWSIRYLFGRDGRGDYLDYYAAHAMLSDNHVRIYQDGETQSLPALAEFVVYVGAGHLQALAEVREHNSRVGEELRRKGF